MAWCGIVNDQIIGPFFFDAHVNGDTYLEMLIDYILPEIHRRGLDSSQICYMHDGAPSHITANVRQCLDDNFGSWIGRGEGRNKILSWPPRSPDLNMLDFFLWGVLQHRVHMVEYESVDEMAAAIVARAREILPVTLSRVHAHLDKRLRICVRENGQLFEQLIKK